jgi:mono/diheme cytochrome c family protein
MRYSVAVGVLLCLVTLQPVHAQGAVERGRDITIRLCGQCHGTGSADTSPHRTAPTFRRLGARIDLDDLERRLRAGILAGHPEMPAFVLKREEARAVVAYLRSIRAD